MQIQCFILDLKIGSLTTFDYLYYQTSSQQLIKSILKFLIVQRKFFFPLKCVHIYIFLYHTKPFHISGIIYIGRAETLQHSFYTNRTIQDIDPVKLHITLVFIYIFLDCKLEKRTKYIPNSTREHFGVSPVKFK